MRRLIPFLLRLYPAKWRERYGEELAALIEQTASKPATVFDLARGALRMRMTGLSFRALALLLSCLALAVGLMISFLQPAVFTSGAVLRIDSELTDARLWTIASSVMSRHSLVEIINDPRLQLYESERRSQPLEAVVSRMARDIRVTSADGVFKIQFTYRDPAKARLAVELLVAHFLAKGKGVDIRVLDPAGFPQSKRSPAPSVFAVEGVLAGLLLALALAWTRAAVRGTSRGLPFPRTALALSLAGLIAGVAASYLRSEEYRSEAVLQMRLRSIAVPLAPRRVSLENAATIKDLARRITSRESLKQIVEDRGLNLYARERRTEPLEDVIETMRANLHITVASASNHLGTAFLVQFDHPDPLKARAVVIALVNKMTDTNADSAAPGEVQVLDWPGIPQQPRSPRRNLFAAAGFAGGFLLAVLIWLGARLSGTRSTTTYRQSHA